MTQGERSAVPPEFPFGHFSSYNGLTRTFLLNSESKLRDDNQPHFCVFTPTRHSLKEKRELNLPITAFNTDKVSYFSCSVNFK